MTDALSRIKLRKLENADAFPLIALQSIREARAGIDEIEAHAILRARELGASLEDIADAMGITRQGVAYRLKQLAKEHAPHADDVVELSTHRVVAVPDVESETPRVP
ncbi:MAG TPA: hypothetical protein VF108_07840 [Actinomycetota bacterium]